MSARPVRYVCAGCGYEPPPGAPVPFRCPNAGGGDDTDHLITVVLDPIRVRWPDDRDPNPFIRYRTLFSSYHLGLAHGMEDGEYVALVERLDRAVAALDGHGFRVTPFARRAPLSQAVGLSEGGIWVKDETGNVSGSHKGRHLMGILLHLEVAGRLGPAIGGAGRGVDGGNGQGRHSHGGGSKDLAIASCGNAALAAALVARAGDWPLRVFVPTWAEPAILDRLRSLGASIVVTPREEGQAGDPTFHALQRAVADGALPFTCQGTSNGLAIEGGKTLGYEIVSAMREAGETLDRVFVQVGGGALASAVVQALQDAVRLGVLARLPRIHTVQTEGAAPLRRAYTRVRERVQAGEGIQQALLYAVTHRSEFMWPWEQEPKSIATGILDDETYDWAAVVRGMLESDGHPLTVSEARLAEANRLARETTGIDVDPTGSAGVAGLLHLQRGGPDGDALDPGERVAVLFTGVRR